MTYIKSYPLSKLSELRLLHEEDLVRDGRRIAPKKFYVAGYYSLNEIEEHETMPGYKFHEHWKQWLKDEKIYIDKPKTEAK
ncbi:MAG: hypothetical protein WC389_12965 [Lutibacter sp.]|jgi:hypothetical protein